MTPRLILALLLTSFCTTLSAAQRPNVLFIAIDDLRSDLGALGVAHARTPQLEPRWGNPAPWLLRARADDGVDAGFLCGVRLGERVPIVGPSQLALPSATGHAQP